MAAFGLRAASDFAASGPMFFWANQLAQGRSKCKDIPRNGLGRKTAIFGDVGGLF